jgi:competence protein ComEC
MVLAGLVFLAALVWMYATPAYVEYFLADQIIAGKDLGGTVPGRKPGELAVVFFDVKYGDGILVQAPENATTLIDGGEGQFPEAEEAPVYDWAYQLYIPFLNRIELEEFKNFVSTVPYGHHMGVQTDLLANRKISVDNVYWTGYEANFSAHRRFRIHAERKANFRVLKDGDAVDFGPGVRSRVLHARTDSKLKTHASRVLYLKYGNRSFLFASDLPREEEEKLVLNWGKDIESDVLKVGTHGSDDSSGDQFIQYVQPQHAVISVPDKESNPLGAPHEPVIENLENVDAEIYRTFEDGHVAFYTDGESLRVQRDAFSFLGSE